MLYTLLIVVLILMLLGLPAWPYSQDWGAGPSSVAGIILIVILILILVGRL